MTVNLVHILVLIKNEFGKEPYLILEKINLRKAISKFEKAHIIF